MICRPVSGMPTSTRSIAGSLLAVLLMVLTPLGSSSLTEAADTLPDNALASRYGTGWECMTGFERIANRCARVVVPANAYLDASGDRWRCDRGRSG